MTIVFSSLVLESVVCTILSVTKGKINIITKLLQGLSQPVLVALCRRQLLKININMILFFFTNMNLWLLIVHDYVLIYALFSGSHWSCIVITFIGTYVF
jgi:predicted benzoate:H+ symporter BenE